MATKKAKKAKARKRRPDPKVWAQPKFKALLDSKGCMSCAGLKIMVENQRGINGKLYEAIEAAINAIKQDHPATGKRGGPLDEALILVQSVPGDGPPGCTGGGN
jgi:hypothetical protein